MQGGNRVTFPGVYAPKIRICQTRMAIAVIQRKLKKVDTLFQNPPSDPDEREKAGD